MRRPQDALSAVGTWLMAPTTTVLAPLLRIGMCGWLLWERIPGAGERLSRMVSNRPLEALNAPLMEALLGAFGLSPTPALLVVVAHVAAVAAVCAIVGLCTRPALLVFGLSFLTLMGVQSGYGFFNHTPALPAQLLFALAVVPGTTALSVDRAVLWWWRRRRATTTETATETATTLAQALLPPAPRFGEVLLLLNVGVVYAAAGYAKLRYGAYEWLNGETLSFYVSRAAETQYWLRDAQGRIVAYSYMASPSALALRVSTSTALCAFLSWASLLLELLAPVLLVWRPGSRVLWCASAIVFHAVIRQWMNIGFAAWICIDALILSAVVLPAAWAFFRRRRVRSLG
jgi:uncharacterized membrane protein YphA (DoxX/SURF4 family)